MERVLIIDDDAVRVPALTRYVHSMLPDAEVTHSTTFVSDWDGFSMVMLDHDLGAGGDVYDHVKVTFPEGYSGEAVIVIHSMNPVGARNIYHQLGNRGVLLPYSRILTLLT